MDAYAYAGFIHFFRGVRRIYADACRNDSPLSLLTKMSRYCSALRFPNSGGMGPVSGRAIQIKQDEEMNKIIPPLFFQNN